MSSSGGTPATQESVSARLTPSGDASGSSDSNTLQAEINAANAAGGGLIQLYQPGSAQFYFKNVALLAKVGLIGKGHNVDGPPLRCEGVAGQDMVRLTTDGANRASQYRLERLGFHGGANQVNMGGSPGRSEIVIEDCGFFGAGAAGLAVPSGALERLTVIRGLWSGGQYSFKMDPVAVGGMNFWDKSHFEDCDFAGAGVNAIYYNGAESDSIEFTRCVIGSAQQHGLVAQGGLGSWTFDTMNTENNGIAGNGVATTGSIANGSNQLTVASAAGMAAGNPITVQGARDIYGIYWARDLSSTITAIAGNVITLADNAGNTVANAAVTTALYDDFNFPAGMSDVTFIGGKIGGSYAAGNLRYAIGGNGINRLTLIGVGQAGNAIVYAYGGEVDIQGSQQMAIRPVVSLNRFNWRPIASMGPDIQSAQVTNQLLTPGGGAALDGAQSTGALIYLDPTNWPAHALLRVRAVVQTNAVAPAVNYTVGIYPVNALGGASGVNPTVHTLQAAQKSVTINTPGASSQTTALTATEAIPAAGYYVLAYSTSGAPAAGSLASVLARLEVAT